MGDPETTPEPEVTVVATAPEDPPPEPKADAPEADAPTEPKNPEAA